MTISKELPAGWSTASLNVLFDPRSLKISPKKIKDTPYIGLEHVEPHTTRLLKTISSDITTSSSSIFYTGDILYGRMRPYLNKVTIPDFNGLSSPEFIILPKVDGINNKYFVYRLSSNDFVEFACSKCTGDRPRVRWQQISDFKVAIPPSTEQTRIVAKLEELLSELDAGVAELKAAQKKLQRYRQSLLKAAVDGSLTADWRTQQKAVRAEYVEARNPASPSTSSGQAEETGAELLARILKERRRRWEEKQLAKFKDQGKTPPKGWQRKYPEPVAPDTSDLPALPEGWVWASVQQTGDVQLGRQRAPKYHSGSNMVPYLRVANVFEDRIDVSDVMEMHFSKEEEEVFALQFNDILLNEGQSLELVGRPAIYRDELPKSCFTNTLVRFRPEKGIHPDFALTIFLHYMHSGRFRKIATITTNIAHLGAARFAAVEFPVPSTEEQTQISHILEEHLNNIQQQNYAITLALKQSAAQRQNILRAAFAGELVPQDPNDEPASVLLERIRAERAARPKTARPRGTRTPRKNPVSTPAPAAEPKTSSGDAPEAQLPSAPSGSSSTPSVARPLAELRKAAGLNQSAVAKAMGLNQAYISQMENGKRALTTEQRSKLSEILGVTTEELP